jgi:FANCI solenoid 1
MKLLDVSSQDVFESLTLQSFQIFRSFGQSARTYFTNVPRVVFKHVYRQNNIKNDLLNLIREIVHIYFFESRQGKQKCRKYSKMSKAKGFEVKFNAVKGDSEKLKKLFEKHDVDEICSATLKADEDLGFSLWSATLVNLDDEEKLFEFIEKVLPKLNRDQLSTKVLNDFYHRLCIELSRFSLEFCVKVASMCKGRIQFGDPKACFFKDILPATLQILAKDDRSITFDGVTKTSSEYRDQIIKEILDNPFKVTILTSITSMFK